MFHHFTTSEHVSPLCCFDEAVLQQDRVAVSVEAMMQQYKIAHAYIFVLYFDLYNFLITYNYIYYYLTN